MSTRPQPTIDVVRGRALTVDVPARSVKIPAIIDDVTASLRVFSMTGAVLRTYVHPELCPVDRFYETVRLTLSAEQTSELQVGTMFYDVLLVRTGDVQLDVPSSGFWRVRTQPPTETPAPSFAHHVFIDHDYGTEDALRYVTPWGSPQVDAVVQVFLRADYEARVFQALGVTKTRHDGRWAAAIPVLPGYDYVVQFAKSQDSGPDIVTISV